MTGKSPVLCRRNEHRAFDLLRQLEHEIELLRDENSQLKQQLDIALKHISTYSNLELQDGTTNTVTFRGRSHSGGEGRTEDKPKGGSKVSKKIQKAYQASTNRIVSTFARHDPTILQGNSSATWYGHSDGIWHVTCGVIDGMDIAASSSADRSCRLWLVSSGVCFGQYTGHKASVNAAQFYIAGEHDPLTCLTAGGDGVIHQWSLPRNYINPRKVPISSTHDEQDGSDYPSSVYTISKSDALYLGHQGPVSSIALCHNHQLVSGSHDGTGRLWDMSRTVCLLQLPGHEQEVTDVCCHYDGRFVITSSKDSTFRMWDFRQSAIREVSVCQGHVGAVNATAIIDDYYIASTSEDCSLKIWDSRKIRSPVHGLRLNTPGNKTNVSPTKRHLAVPCDSGSIKIYDPIAGVRLGSLAKGNATGHVRTACCVGWLSDDRLISCSFDHTIKLWSLKQAERPPRPGLKHRESSFLDDNTPESQQSSSLSQQQQCGDQAGPPTNQHPSQDHSLLQQPKLNNEK